MCAEPCCWCDSCNGPDLGELSRKLSRYAARLNSDQRASGHRQAAHGVRQGYGVSQFAYAQKAGFTAVLVCLMLSVPRPNYFP